MITAREGDGLVTTHAVLRMANPLQPAPLMALPVDCGASEWVLLGTTSLLDPQGDMHFFWFWRGLRPQEEA